MITERTLRNWRRDALATIHSGNYVMVDPNKNPEAYNVYILKEIEIAKRVLALTQELLDLQLMRKG